MRFEFCARASALVLSGLTVLVASAPAAAATYITSVVATGLNNPRGLAFGPDGALYIAEAGFNDAVPAPGDTFAYSMNGSITQVMGSMQTRIVTGLPTIYNSLMDDVTGPQDIVFSSNGTGYVVVGLGADPAIRPAGSLLGHVLSFTPDGSYADFADVSAFEAMNNPAGGPVDSNPYHLAASSGGLLVTDAGANTVTSFSATGDGSLVAAFPSRFIGQPAPASDSVPTGVTVGPDGTIYVAELTGFPFTPGAAQIYSIAPDGSAPSVFGTGFTNLTDITFGPDGNLYALSYDLDSILGPEVGGGIFRVSSSGLPESVFSTGLVNPTGLTIGDDGSFYVTTWSAGVPGSGQVVKISAVPEPATWAMMLLGFGMLGQIARRSRRSTQLAS